MIAAAFDDDARARVANRQTFARAPRRVEAAAGRAVEHGVADDGVVSGNKRNRFRRPHDDLAPRHPFTHVVLRFTLEGQLNPADIKDPERLTRDPAEVQLHRRRRQTGVAVNARQLTGEPRPDRTFAVGDGVAFGERFAGSDSFKRVLIDRFVERRRVLGTVVVPHLRAAWFDAARVGVAQDGAQVERGFGVRQRFG